jgi:hypothetical protein
MTTDAVNGTLNAFGYQLRLGLMGCLLIVAPQLAAAQQADQARAGEHVEHASPAKLVEIVREATRQFIDVNNAGPAGYESFLGCVSGQDHGAMGVHYVNGTLVGDGRIDATRPEALIYEPMNGKMRLVGVEYIVDAATWLASNPSPPVLEGQTFLLVTSPKRYNIPSFFVLRVWRGETIPRAHSWTGITE